MVLFNEDDSLTFGQRIPVPIALMHEEDFYVVLELPVHKCFTWHTIWPYYIIAVDTTNVA
jgi:hypothetical protein